MSHRVTASQARSKQRGGAGAGAGRHGVGPPEESPRCGAQQPDRERVAEQERAYAGRVAGRGGCIGPSFRVYALAEQKFTSFEPAARPRGA